jgi:hypothetical protein
MSKKYSLLRLEQLHNELDKKWFKSKSKKNKAYFEGKMEGYNDAMFIIKNIKYYKKSGFDLDQKRKDESN